MTTGTFDQSIWTCVWLGILGGDGVNTEWEFGVWDDICLFSQGFSSPAWLSMDGCL